MASAPECIAWNLRPRATQSILVMKQLDSFDARGKLLVYQRGDKFPGLPTLFMDLWLAKVGTVFSRLHARGIHVDQLDFEVVGLQFRSGDVSDSPSDNERLVPAAVRKRYDEWVIDRIEYPDE